MHLVVVELRGEIQRALKTAGFRESAAGNRYVSVAGRRTEHDSDHLSTLLKTLAAHAEVEVRSRPLIRSVMGQSASIQIASAPAGIPYLVRTGTKSFELREAAVGTALGITINLTARAGDDADHIEISPLKISTTTLDGREQIQGLDLDVGKPIVSTRTLESSITVVEGAEVNGIALPGPPSRQAVLFIKAVRWKATPDKVVPGVVIPDPSVSERIPVPSPEPPTKPQRSKR